MVREISKFLRRISKSNIRFEANSLSPNVTAELEVRACSISSEVIYTCIKHIEYIYRIKPAAKLKEMQVQEKLVALNER